MSIAVVQKLTNQFRDNAGDNATFNFGQNFTSGNTVFFLLSSWETRPDAMTIAGLPAILDLSLAVPGSGDTVSLWRLNNVPAGRNDVVTGIGGNYLVGALYEVSGLKPGGPQTTGSALGTSDFPQVTASPAAAKESFVLTGFSNGSSGSHSEGVGPDFDLDYANAGGEGGGGASKILGPTTYNSIFGGSIGTISWACIIASYEMATSASVEDISTETEIFGGFDF